MEFNPDLHHRRSIRLPSHDYSSPGAYFITICTFEREELFGKIKNGEMRSNEFGLTVADEWINTSFIRPYVALDEFVIMPNHFHGIVWIHEHDDPYGGGMARFCRGMACHAPTYGQFGHPTKHSIPTIIRSFKSAVTKRIHEIQKYPHPIRQRNYWEHVIRDEVDLQRIQKYIINNPLAWEAKKKNSDRCQNRFFHS